VIRVRITTAWRKLHLLRQFHVHPLVVVAGEKKELCDCQSNEKDQNCVALHGKLVTTSSSILCVSGVSSFDVRRLRAHVCEKGDVRELLGRKRHVRVVLKCISCTAL